MAARPDRVQRQAFRRGEAASRGATARGHYRAALDLGVALRDAGRLASADGRMVEDLKARLEQVSAQSAE